MAAITKLLAIVIIVIISLPLMAIISDYDHGDNTLEVIVIAGQSNAAYRQANTTIVNEDVPIPTTNVYYYGTSSQPIWYGYPSNPTYDDTFDSYGIYSMISNGSWKIGGYEPVLAQSIGKESNCDVLVINVGISSANINYLLPDQIGGTYVKNVIEDALSKVDNKYVVDKVGYVWIQGESDKTTSVSTYIEKFETINEWYHSNGFDTCYLVQTRPSDGGNASMAQLKICQEDSSVILASTAPSTFTVSNGLIESDDLHYTQRGRDIIGLDIDSKINLPYHLKESQGSEIIAILPIMIIVMIILATCKIYIGFKND